MSLRELRKALGKTRAQLARKLKKPQATVSRMERQSDMLISTLDKVVHALGGRVRIIVELPGGKLLFLTGLAELTPPTKPRAASEEVRDLPGREGGRQPPAADPAKYSFGSAARIRASGSPSSRRTMFVPCTSETHL